MLCNCFCIPNTVYYRIIDWCVIFFPVLEVWSAELRCQLNHELNWMIWVIALHIPSLPLVLNVLRARPVVLQVSLFGVALYFRTVKLWEIFLYFFCSASFFSSPPLVVVYFWVRTNVLRGHLLKFYTKSGRYHLFVLWLWLLITITLQNTFAFLPNLSFSLNSLV